MALYRAFDRPLTVSEINTVMNKFDDVHGVIKPSAELFADVHGLDYTNAVRRFYDIHSVDIDYEGKIIVRVTS